MPPNRTPSANPQAPKWMIPIVVIACLAAVVLLSNHSKDAQTPDGLSVVSDPATYNSYMSKAQDLAAVPLQSYAEGKMLTNDDLKNIAQAATWIDAANLYRPTGAANDPGSGSRSGPFFLSATAHAALFGELARSLSSTELAEVRTIALGPSSAAPSPDTLSANAKAALQEFEKADQQLRQGFLNEPDKLNAKGWLALYDAHYERSRIQFQLGNYQLAFDEASIAAKGVPNDPEYLIQMAKTALQVGKAAIAREEVIAALALKPSVAGGEMLRKYLKLPAPTH